MKVLIQSDELAKDVASAESLLERHQEHKVKIPYKNARNSYDQQNVVLAFFDTNVTTCSV